MPIQPTPVEILLIEDNEGDIVLTQEAFEASRLEHRISVARDGMEGLNFLRKKGEFSHAPTPDLILLDLNMPRMNGLEVLQQLKSDEILDVIPVVILTTSKASTDVMKSYKLKANCYITKPINFGDYYSVIESIENFWFSTVVLPSKVA